MEKSARRVSEGVMIGRSVPTRIATARVGRSAARVSAAVYWLSNSAASPPGGARGWRGLLLLHLAAARSCPP